MNSRKFITPPRNQGQIVEVAYMLRPEGVVMLVYDSSDKSAYYHIAPWTNALYRWAESSGPQNTPPPGGRWGKELTRAQLEKKLGWEER